MFDLALALGKSVNEIETTFSRRELTEWRIYASKAPFGPERDNLHAAIIAATLANVNRGKHGRVSKPIDFMPYAKKAGPSELDSRLKTALMTIGKGKT